MISKISGEGSGSICFNDHHYDGGYGRLASGCCEGTVDYNQYQRLQRLLSFRSHDRDTEHTIISMAAPTSSITTSLLKPHSAMVLAIRITTLETVCELQRDSSIDGQPTFREQRANDV